MLTLWLGFGFVATYFFYELRKNYVASKKLVKPKIYSAEPESANDELAVQRSEPAKKKSSEEVVEDKQATHDTGQSSNQALNKNKLKRSDNAVMYVYLFLYLAFWVSIALVTYEFTQVFLMGFVPLLSGRMLLFALDLYGQQLKEPKERNEEDERIYQGRNVAIYTTSFIAIVFLPFIASPFLFQLIDDSFSLIGIRHSNTTLVLNDNNYKTLKSLADEYGVILNSCSSQSDRHILRNVNALWHGIGERSLIQLVSKKKEVQFNVELERGGVTVARIGEGISKIASCVTLNTDNLFKPYESTLTGEGILQVEKFIEETKSYLESEEQKIVSVTIDGHTDRIPVLNADDSNLALSIRRANEINTRLNSLFQNIPNSMIQINGHGASRSITNCDKGLIGKELSDCLSLDRRVDVRLRLETDKAK
jgi:outer membrane protein OmpA-like peptidoglycan-associated protein